MTTAPPSVALLGLGIMGGRIARRLAGAGVLLAVWNRDPAKASPLAALGATVAADPVAAVRDRELVLLVLSDAAAVEHVLWERGVAEALTPGAIVVDMGSIAPAAARAHARRLSERGVVQLDAPMSGGIRGADEGTLAILVGGEASQFERARPLLELLGRPTHIGPSGAGQVAKAVNQLIVGVTIAAVAEALTLAEAAGAPPAAVREALLGGFADSRVLREHGRRMLERDFVAGGKIATQLKDMRTASELAVEHELALPLTGCATELYSSLREHFGGELDHSSVILELERRAGRPAPDAQPM
jgi:2-hydroxy-3-oxopropionate reductase